MSKIEQLIKEKCPNGVEYKKIKDVCNDNFWIMPSTPKYIQDGIPYITSKNIRNGQILFDNVKYIAIKDYDNISNNRPIHENDFLISMIGTIGEVGIVRKKDLPFYGQNMYLLRLNFDIVNLKYFYYFFTSLKVKTILLNGKNNSNQSYIKTKNIEELMVPVPPIEVQEEIVKILDKFSELEEELEEELEARMKQYEFYKNKIFKFENRKDVKWLKLKEIAIEMYRGNGIKRKEITREGVPCVRYGEIYTSYNIWFQDCISHTSIDVVSNPKTFTTNDLLFAITGENVDDIAKTIAYVGQGICYAGGDIVVLKHKQNGKYLSYALSTKNAKLQKGKGKVKSKVVHSSIPSIQEIVVPIIKLEEQEHIVKILDKFNKLVNDISEGLPAEIENRRKQYEYYRNKLLSFKDCNCKQVNKNETIK